MGTKLWRSVQKVFHTIGLAQNFVLLALFYFLILGPVAIIARIAGRDFLGLQRRESESFWTKRSAEPPSLERARHQS